jgi:trehalose 6-phosphate phosphatase
VLIDNIDGFYLEDKGWSLALHARDADPDIGAQIVLDAQNILHECQLGNQYRVLGGDRFLEVGPSIANKGLAVQYLVDSNQWRGSLLIYIGDDDKDEEAFAIIQQCGGITIKVNRDGEDTSADLTLRDPNSVREWLKNQFLM